MFTYMYMIIDLFIPNINSLQKWRCKTEKGTSANHGLDF